MIDLNADLGESWYDHRVGNDAALMPLLDSCNVGCGFHGGDVITQRETVELAREHGVRVGAHPSFPDRKNFGRKSVQLDLQHLTDLLLYQVAGLQAVAGDAGAVLSHLKPHGALYHYANGNAEAARAVVHTARSLSIGIVYGPPVGELSNATRAAGLEFWAEGFADRVYEPDFTLRARSLPDHEISDPEKASAQALWLARDGRIKTICLHGDHAGAVARARAVRAILPR